ncbi:hypothetical protein [Paracidovorax cattleyae]|nr:hypothetical protein [Paracidovorax cattleyae]
MGIYKEKWDIYRRKSRIAMAALIFSLPIMAIFCAFFQWFFDFDLGMVFPFFAALWAMLWGFLAYRLIRFPCPRCEVPFLLNQNIEFSLKRACPKCGLKLYEDFGEDGGRSV